MKKKFLGLVAIILTLMLALACVGCASSSSSSSSSGSKSESTEEKAEEKTEEVNQVLFDNEYCSCTLTGYDEGILEPFQMKLMIENKTEDKEMMFSVRDVSVNGFMCEPFWAETVAGGKKANTTLGWLSSTLEDAGITGDVETVELHFVVYDSNDFMADYFVDQVVTINP